MTTNVFSRIAELDPVREPEATPDWGTLAPVLLSFLDERTMPMETQIPTKVQQDQTKRRRGWFVAVAAFAVVIVVGLTAALLANQSTDAEPATPSSPQPLATTITEPTVTPRSDDPADVINDYVAAYNSGDVDKAMVLFTEDSTITGHPTGTGSANSLDEIQALHLQDLSYGRGYTISNVETSGNTVTWDTVWGDNYGCVEGHTTVTNGDKIVSWSWGTVVNCP